MRHLVVQHFVVQHVAATLGEHMPKDAFSKIVNPSVRDGALLLSSSLTISIHRSRISGSLPEADDPSQALNAAYTPDERIALVQVPSQVT